MSPDNRGALDGAFADALKRQDEHKKRHEQDLEELSRLAEEGRSTGRKAGLFALAIATVLVITVLVIMFKEPSSRGIFGFLLLCLSTGAAYKIWKATA